MPHANDRDRRAMSQLSNRSSVGQEATREGGARGSRGGELTKGPQHLRPPCTAKRLQRAFPLGLLRACHLCVVTPGPCDTGSS